MKGLSFSQPWLWAVFDPTANKDIENRFWPASMSQIDEPFACHAAKSYDDDGLHRLLELGFDPPQELPKSAILGTARIDRIVTSPKTLTETQRRWYMGDADGMRDGKQVYGHILVDRVVIPTPIPWSGALGFWQLPPLVETEILFQSGTALGHLAWQRFVDYLPDILAHQRRLFADWNGNGPGLVAKVQRYVELNPGQHLWFDWVAPTTANRPISWDQGPHNHRGTILPIASCAVCAGIKPPPTAKKQPPCAGITPLTFRGAA